MVHAGNVESQRAHAVAHSDLPEYPSPAHIRSSCCQVREYFESQLSLPAPGLKIRTAYRCCPNLPPAWLVQLPKYALQIRPVRPSSAHMGECRGIKAIRTRAVQTMSVVCSWRLDQQKWQQQQQQWFEKRASNPARLGFLHAG